MVKGFPLLSSLSSFDFIVIFAEFRFWRNSAPFFGQYKCEQPNELSHHRTARKPKQQRYFIMILQKSFSAAPPSMTLRITIGAFLCLVASTVPILASDTWIGNSGSLSWSVGVIGLPGQYQSMEMT